MDQSGFQMILPGEGSETTAQLALLGLWQPSSATESFSISGEQPGVVWRADLPEDPAESARALNSHALALRQVGHALAAAGPLLVQDLGHMAGFAPTGLAYELPAGAAPDRREILAQALTREAEGASFGLKDDLAHAAQVVGRFSGQIRRLVDQFALVESRHAGRCAARTRVDWLGDVHTWWVPGSPASSISDHGRVVAQALATRQEWLRLVFVLTAGAARISLAMATSPFNPVAIWTAWAYVQKVIEQYHSVQQTKPVKS
jgi:hypothetical protein